MNPIEANKVVVVYQEPDGPRVVLALSAQEVEPPSTSSVKVEIYCARCLGRYSYHSGTHRRTLHPQTKCVSRSHLDTTSTINYLADIIPADIADQRKILGAISNAKHQPNRNVVATSSIHDVISIRESTSALDTPPPFSMSLSNASNIDEIFIDLDTAPNIPTDRRIYTSERSTYFKIYGDFLQLSDKLLPYGPNANSLLIELDGSTADQQWASETALAMERGSVRLYAIGDASYSESEGTRIAVMSRHRVALYPKYRNGSLRGLRS